MTEAEKNEIVGLVMNQISSQAVDFDIETEQPQANDLLTAVRQTSSGAYVGVTIKWDDVARIATELANQAATRAEQAKTNVENMKSSVEQTVTDFNALAEEKKQEVQGVYQSDLNELKGDLAYMLESSENMLNPENNRRETYATVNGINTSPDYAIWFTTEKIKVVGGNVLQCNTPVNSIVIYNADGTSDKINSVSKLYNTVDFPFTLPLTADSVILTFRMTYIDAEIMVNMGNELLPYNPFGHKEFNKSLIYLKENPVIAKLNNASTASDFLSDFKQSLAKNVVVNYVANFDTFNSLKIGYTSKDDFSANGGYTDYFEITPTQFIMHREDVQDIAWEHGLTIEKFIGVELSFDITKNYTLTITTIGGTYTKSNYIYLGRTYYPFAVIDGINVKNNKLSATCKDLRKNIFAFGDSYFSNMSTRWLYYLDNKDSICINQYAGESSASAIVDFRTLVKYGNPKFVLWCLGMNDKTDTDENTPNQNWLPYIQEVIETCETNNIVPILATIPSVPNISHKGKNKWIRESGYRYIDFAKAVELNENGSWYNGLLSSDNVHPTENGAKVLYSRAIADFADLLVIN